MADNTPLANSMSAKLQQAYTLSIPWRLKWDKCMAYVRGDQLLGYQTGREDLTPIDARKKKGRVVVNQTINLYRHICARLVTGYPSMAALPASESVDDIVKAQSSEQALRYYWQSARIKDVLRHSIQWLAPTGTVGLRTRYNTKKQCVQTECIRPYDLRFEPYCNDPNESRFIGVVSYVSKEDIVEQYPEYAEELEQKATIAVRYYSNGPQAVPEDRYELIDVYYRDGRHEVWAGGVRVFETTTPNNRLPVQIIRYTEVEGYLWGVGMVEPILEQQDLYNSMRTQILINAKITANPKVLIPDEADLGPGVWTDKEGERVRYKGATAPRYAEPPNLPQYMVEEPSKILSEMYDIVGLHGTTLGKRTIGLDSGVAVDATAANDVQQLQLTMESIESAVVEMAKDVLAFMKAYYTEAKMVRMLDQGGRLIWAELDATSLEDDPEIFLEAGSLFRSESQDRDAKTMQLLGSGLLTPDQAKRNLTYRLEPLHVLDQITAMRHAREVLEATANLGAPVQLWPTDDLEAMERVTKQFMQSPEFYNIDGPPQPDPVTGQLRTPKQDAVANLYDQIVNMLLAKSNPQQAGQMPSMPGSSSRTVNAPNGQPMNQGLAGVAGQADNAETSSQSGAVSGDVAVGGV